MGYVTPEQITQAKEIDLLTYLQRFDPHELVHISGNTYCTREHDSLKISNGKWNWFSRGIGGKTALDYLIKVQGFSFTQAVEALVGQNLSSLPHTFKTKAKEQQSRKLLLPQASRCATHAVSYLHGRGIDYNLIDYCIQTGRLYESQPYTLEEIKERILQNLCKQVPFPEVEHKPPRRYRVRDRPRKKVTGLRALYFRYCYELHIIVKRPASVKRMSFLLREDIAKLDRLDAETRFLGKQHIGTIGELTAHREKASAEIDTLTAQRQELRKELRRLNRQGDAIATDEVKSKISAISSRLKALRKEVVLCDGIAQRSGQVKENLERLMTQKETERKELTQDELFRRRGGAGREDVTGNR